MIRYTEFKRSLRLETLALDSIYRILTADERIILHRWEYVEKSTDAIYAMMRWIDENEWKSPFMKYPEFHKDVLYYEDENGQLQPLENYPKAHPEITEQLRNL